MKIRHKLQKKAKLDEIMKLLFKLSKKVMINLLNGLFHEDFSSTNITIEYGNTEFIADNLDRIIGDMFITIRKEDYIFNYHIEFQTTNDQTMVIRMFRYGFEKALENSDLQNDVKVVKLDFPRQLVIFLEENANIDDQLTMILKLPDSREIEYTVPVMKYWQYTAEDLVEKKMYALLPLQVFKVRKDITAIYKSNRPEDEKAELISLRLEKLLGTVRSVLKLLEELHDKNELYVRDLEKILRVLTNITEYLYSKYGIYRSVSKEVYEMVTTLYNPLIKEEGKREGKIEGKIEDILELLEEHGELSAALITRIKAETNLETIKRWLKLAARVGSIDEFVHRM